MRIFISFLFSRCIDSQSKPNLLEKILLLLGALMFFACGGLILASLEQVLPDLYDNAIILGSLSFLIGFLYLIDLADPLSRKSQTMTQTEERQIKSKSNPVSTWPRTKVTRDAQTTTDSLPSTPQLPKATHTSPSLNIPQDEIDFIETKNFPERQSPVFAKVKTGKPVKQKYIARDYINPGFQEPWEEVEHPVMSKPPSNNNHLRGSVSRASSQTPDFGYQSGSTYVSAPPVDRGNLVIRKARPVLYTYYPEYSTEPGKHDEFKEEDEQMQPMRRGYVANTARMWDSRLSSKSKSPESLDTVV